MESKFNFNNFTVEVNAQTDTRRAIGALVGERDFEIAPSYMWFKGSKLAHSYFDDECWITDENGDAVSCKKMYALIENPEPCTIKMAPLSEENPNEQPIVHIITATHKYTVKAWHPLNYEKEYGYTNWIGRAIFPDAPYKC